jgi:hypothetical protein
VLGREAGPDRLHVVAVGQVVEAPLHLRDLLAQLALGVVQAAGVARHQGDLGLAGQVGLPVDDPAVRQDDRLLAVDDRVRLLAGEPVRVRGRHGRGLLGWGSGRGWRPRPPGPGPGPRRRITAAR